jgi:hypothetical protein
MSKLKSVAAALACVLAQTATQAAPVISPYADDLPFAAYSADQTAGGSAQSAFNGGYWNAGGWFTHWVQADMLSTQTLTEVRVTVGEETGYNTAKWVYLSNSPIAGNYAGLTPLATQAGVTTAGQVLTFQFAPTSGRYLEIVSFGGGGPGHGSWVALGDGTARTNWVDTGIGPAVPEPQSFALMLAGLALLVAFRKVTTRS